MLCFPRITVSLIPDNLILPADSILQLIDWESCISCSILCVWSASCVHAGDRRGRHKAANDILCLLFPLSFRPWLELFLHHLMNNWFSSFNLFTHTHTFLHSQYRCSRTTWLRNPNSVIMISRSARTLEPSWISRSWTSCLVPKTSLTMISFSKRSTN